MNQEVLIGKASYGRSSGGGGHGWFHIEDNKDNVFRVLPPMKSLAPHGKYAKYYRTHRGFRGTDNRQKPFLCIEESDYKTKVIKTHCPVCDWVAAIEEEIKKFKARGATDEQIRDYRNKNVFPFQAESKYYLNVVNQEGKIGVLPIGSKMFKSLEALALEQEKQGRDITGMEGIYLNFKKQSRFKGDRDAIHSVSVYMQPGADGSFRFVTHTITAEFAAKLGPEAADLGNLFKVLSAEQIARIVSLEGDARAQYVDTLFNAPEQDKDQGGMKTQLPNAGGATAVSRVESTPNGGFQVQQPTLPSNFNQAPVPANNGQFQGVQNITPSAPATGGLTGFGPQAPALGGNGNSTAKLSDEEFAAMMRPTNKG